MDLGNNIGFLPLTAIELHCLCGCAEGHSDEQMGRELEMTTAEIASVINIVLLKLRVPNRLAGLAKAARIGLLEKVDA
ncbi:hypothetical protein [Hoeflea sp. AS16]|uniref:hypothetical protein n=1 Tax=unclassified Hoeflea TaxID=2614931 RepID=UPI00316C90D8